MSREDQKIAIQETFDFDQILQECKKLATETAEGFLEGLKLLGHEEDLIPENEKRSWKAALGEICAEYGLKPVYQDAYVFVSHISAVEGDDCDFSQLDGIDSIDMDAYDYDPGEDDFEND